MTGPSDQLRLPLVLDFDDSGKVRVWRWKNLTAQESSQAFPSERDALNARIKNELTFSQSGDSAEWPANSRTGRRFRQSTS